MSTMSPYTADDYRVALWIVTHALPAHILQGEAIKPLLPYLTGLLRDVQSRLVVSRNWYGITTATTRYLEEDEEAVHLEYLRKQRPELHEDKLTTASFADAYCAAIEDLARSWRLEPNYGYYVLHAVVDSSLTSGGKRVMSGLFATRPGNFKLKITVNPLSRYEIDELDSLPNAIREYHQGEAIPDVRWSHWFGPLMTEPQDPADDDTVGLEVRVRDLADLREYMDSILKAMSARSGLPLRKARKNAHLNAPRNVRWFYLNHCEGRSLRDLADSEVDSGLDESVISKGIAHVRRLLANPELRLS